ncbi:MAG: YggT family protein [Cyanobacteria bacterium HKST-UBA06]|nr:YggT family protein [Cyanobacteria bacterium HKST-UBA04]MCA9806639.1 YggT family protein [Cyanobacteria bacterium HKST-UBA06]MCA9841551.1 YggT family protein [Cyanobacteria bacterium HKST-UBA03]
MPLLPLVFEFLVRFLNFVLVVLFVRILLSWIIQDPFKWRKQPFKLMQDLTEPILAPTRQLLPPIGGLDLSPILAFFLLEILIRLFEMLKLMTLNP